MHRFKNVGSVQKFFSTHAAGSEVNMEYGPNSCSILVFWKIVASPAPSMVFPWIGRLTNVPMSNANKTFMFLF